MAKESEITYALEIGAVVFVLYLIYKATAGKATAKAKKKSTPSSSTDSQRSQRVTSGAAGMFAQEVAGRPIGNIATVPDMSNIVTFVNSLSTQSMDDSAEGNDTSDAMGNDSGDGDSGNDGDAGGGADGGSGGDGGDAGDGGGSESGGSGDSGGEGDTEDTSY